MKVSVTTLIGVAGLAASLALGACATAPNGDYTIFGKDTGVSAAQVLADEQAALATVCPVVVVLNANPPQMSAVQKTALAQLTSACNAPPTSGVMLAADILSAYEAILPLVHK